MIGQKNGTSINMNTTSIDTGNQTIITKNLPLSEFPTTVKPMLSTLIDKPFDNKDWVFEVKWDGYELYYFYRKQKKL